MKENRVELLELIDVIDTVEFLYKGIFIFILLYALLLFGSCYDRENGKPVPNE